MTLSLRRCAITISRRSKPPDCDRSAPLLRLWKLQRRDPLWIPRKSVPRRTHTRPLGDLKTKRVASKLPFLGSERLWAFLKRNQLASFQKPGTTKDRGKHLSPLYRSFTSLAAAGEQKLLAFAHEKRSLLGEVPGRPSDKPASAPDLLWLISAGRGSPGIRDAVLLSQGQRSREAVCHHTCP